MGDSDGCATDYVELRNGLTEGDRLVGRYCGSVSRVCVCVCVSNHQIIYQTFNEYLKTMLFVD